MLTNDDCLNKPYLYDHLKVKKSILNTDKEIWKPERRALNPAFNPKMLQKYVPAINRFSLQLIKQIEPYRSDRSGGGGGNDGNLYHTIFISQMEMVTRTLLGSNMDMNTKELSVVSNFVKMIMGNIQYRIVRFWLRWDFIFNLTKVGREEKIPFRDCFDLIEQLYRHKVTEIESLNQSQGIDHLKKADEENATNFLERGLILEQIGFITHDNFIEQLAVIIVAGLDTSATTIYATLLLLAINQEHQDLVVAELRSIFDTADCEVTHAHLAGMQYLDCVIKESLRIFPPVPLIARKTTADIPLAKGTIPTNSMLFIHIMKLHRNPTIWGENALEFDPDRFLPENIAKRPPYSYIPFSGGARNCIGMKYAMVSAKVVLANILRRFKFSTDLKFEDIRVRVDLILELKTNKNALQIEERNF